VTIGVGFLCNDGVVLGSDTEESYEESKTSVNKIEVIAKTFCHSGIVASGRSQIIEYIVPQIRSLLETDWQNNGNIEAQLKHLMPEIYQSKAMKAFPARQPEDKLVDLLVACRPRGKKAALFQIHSSLVTRISSAAVVGCGPIRDVAEEFDKFSLTTRKAAWAALYVVYLAKERWPGIGGLSQILKIWNNGKMDDERVWDQPRREKLFSSYRFLNHIMLLETTNIETQDERFNKMANVFIGHLRDLRKQVRQIEYEYLKHKYKTDLNAKLTKTIFRKLLADQAKAND